MDNHALGRLLLQGGFLSNEPEIESHVKEAKEKHESFLSYVIKAKKLDFGVIATFLAQKFQLPFLDIEMFDLNFVPEEIDIQTIEKYRILPLKKNGNTIIIAISDPTAQNIVHDLKFQTGSNIIAVVVEENKLIATIGKYLQSKGASFNTNAMTADIFAEFQEKEQEAAANAAAKDANQAIVDDAPIVKFVTGVLMEAIMMKASDIHFEPYEKTYRVRFRKDGSLFESKKVPPAVKEQIVSYIKIKSDMDISEKRKTQDGRMRFPLANNKKIDFRVSSLPVLYGEKIVMRILDSSADALDIDKLGYEEIQKKNLIDAVSRPYGMVLVTGPTGSGKTVSLYSCIKLLNQDDVNICTAEDPVEINLYGVNQVEITEKVTFADALKAFLRQDPDIILVGEIRDLGTADIAIKAAQTGHMVLSTLHTNDAPKTITRLLNMGVKPFNISSSVILITAQRLARRLCPHCKTVEDIPPEILLQEGLDPEELSGYGKTWKAYRAQGCNECNNKGYSGRVGIYQVMPITEEIRKIILKEGTDIEIAEEARRTGVLSLREAGLKKVKEGTTSLEEVVKTTNID
jgi:type IV pilus assembly protein PilB